MGGVIWQVDFPGRRFPTKISPPRIASFMLWTLAKWAWNKDFLAAKGPPPAAPWSLIFFFCAMKSRLRDREREPTAV